MTDPIQAISASEVLRHAAAPSPDLQAQAMKFEQLMAQEPQAGARMAAQPPHADTSVTKTLHSLDEASRSVTADMQRFVTEAPTMDLQTLTTRSMELNLQVATQGMQFTAATSVAQSSKNGLQTLMKNQ